MGFEEQQDSIKTQIACAESVLVCAMDLRVSEDVAHSLDV
jgi:hypothetical protein